MRITKNLKRFNRLVDFHRQGSSWIRREYDIDLNAWIDSQMPYGGSQFGVKKYNKIEIERLKEKVQNLIDNPDLNNPNHSGAIKHLKQLGIIEEE